MSFSFSRPRSYAPGASDPIGASPNNGIPGDDELELFASGIDEVHLGVSRNTLIELEALTGDVRSKIRCITNCSSASDLSNCNSPRYSATS